MYPLLDIHAERLHLLIAPFPAVDRLCDSLIARLALSGPVRVLDGGNHFDVHQIARSIRRQSAQLEMMLQRITIARAFTCYQMSALLANQEANRSPLLALNLLNTFHDENVARSDRVRLLLQCITDLKRITAQATVLVSATPAKHPTNIAFLDRLTDAAEQTWRFESPNAPAQPGLF